MPRKKKTPLDQTGDEALRALFPKEVVAEVKKEAKTALDKRTKAKSK